MLTLLRWEKYWDFNWTTWDQWKPHMHAISICECWKIHVWGQEMLEIFLFYDFIFVWCCTFSFFFFFNQILQKTLIFFYIVPVSHTHLYTYSSWVFGTKNIWGEFSLGDFSNCHKLFLFLSLTVVKVFFWLFIFWQHFSRQHFRNIQNSSKNKQ